MATDLGISDSEVAGLAYDDVIKLYSDSGIPSDGSIIDEIAIIKDILGIKREIAISQVADWSFARDALKGIKGNP